jgi:nitroreductase
VQPYRIELYEVMRVTGTTRAFRPDPVPTDVLYRVLDNARFAPNGGNRQGWRVIVVTDAAKRRFLAETYQGPWQEYLKVRGRPPERTERFARSLAEIPIHLLVLVELKALAVMDKDLPRQSIVGGGSIYPFVQNLLLALRQEGLGAALTTMVVAREPDVFREFGVADGYALAGHILVGWPAEPLATRLRRKPVEEFATRDSFDGPPLSSPA